MGLEKINETKKELGLTTEELSNRSGVSLGTLNKILSGVTKDPKLETIRSIAYALGLTLDDLEDNSETLTVTKLTKLEIAILSSFNKLNDIGQHEANKRVEELTYIDKYRKYKDDEFALCVAEVDYEYLIPNAANEIEGASEEDKKHDDDIMDDNNF